MLSELTLWEAAPGGEPLESNKPPEVSAGQALLCPPTLAC